MEEVPKSDLDLDITNIARLVNAKNTANIYISMAPGKKTNRWNRDLQRDISNIKCNNIQVVVCLLQWSEISKLHITKYPSLAQINGLIYYHMEIKDCEVPRQKNLETFIPLLIYHLSIGDNILIHCRAGLGRAGTICACCLCYFGYDPATAISLIRERRPGAIQNLSQEECIVTYYNMLHQR